VNKQNWKKKGLFFRPNQTLYWQNSHAAIPTSIKIDKNIVRTYFNSRDKENKAYVGFFDWELDTKKVIFKASDPVLTPGEFGFFDDHGVQVTSIVRYGEAIYMYYLGWNPGLKKPLFYTSIGLAISSDGGDSYTKYSDAPIMQRSKFDPWMVSGATVLKENDLWRMYYLSGQKMVFKNDEVISYYDLKYAESSDGIHWNRNGITCLELNKNETNISRLSILKKEKYKAWYPYKLKKNNGYRIGYAESNDGIKWNRFNDCVNLKTTQNSWDSDSLDKVEVIQGLDEKIILYNGNKFGYDGIGMAILKE
jgi:hypothetical protein